MAGNPNRLAGTASITVDGTNYLLVGDFEYNPSSVTRETLSGQDGVHGFSEKKRPGSISASLRDAGNLTVADLNAMDNVTVVAQLANGKPSSAGTCGRWKTRRSNPRMPRSKSSGKAPKFPKPRAEHESTRRKNHPSP